jgi:DNA-binding response OmpR family regulator
MKILIIEDETDLRETLVQSLIKQMYVVESAADYKTALDKLINFDYDCVLLDIMLPDGNGLNLLKELKDLAKSERVIIISAKDAIDDKLKGFEIGADDYLTKPFHLAELNARIKSILRRTAEAAQITQQVGNLEFDIENRVAKVNGVEMILNRKEFDILEYLLINKNRLVQKVALAEHVWGDFMDDADNFEFLYSQVKNLRKKLKDAYCNVEIRAVYGIGYKLEVQAD